MTGPRTETLLNRQAGVTRRYGGLTDFGSASRLELLRTVGSCEKKEKKKRKGNAKEIFKGAAEGLRASRWEEKKPARGKKRWGKSDHPASIRSSLSIYFDGGVFELVGTCAQWNGEARRGATLGTPFRFHLDAMTLE